MKHRYLFFFSIPLFMAAIINFRAGEINRFDEHDRSTASKLYTINTRNAADLKLFFKYTADRIPFVSAHRGGPRKGFPENCIATFENTLASGPAILEIDPRYTKDGHIVLMHDATLDRTTNGTGKVSDHTLAEIRNLQLKDTEGNLTQHRIPTLDEALQWAKGKTILVIDEKDVPIDVRVQKILDNKAGANAIVIAYSPTDIKKCYALSKDVMMEVMMGKTGNVTDLDNSGVPWENVVAFVSHALPENKMIFEEVHKRGAMCILGSSRNYDRQFTSGKISAPELAAGYRSLIEYGADIIEADLAIEAGEALKAIKSPKSSKRKFFIAPE